MTTADLDVLRETELPSTIPAIAAALRRPDLGVAGAIARLQRQGLVARSNPADHSIRGAAYCATARGLTLLESAEIRVNRSGCG